MFVLKIPIAALLWIVWWAVRAEPDAENQPGSDDGGSKYRPPHPRRPFPRGAPPRPPRRSRAARARLRTRSVVARAKRVEYGVGPSLTDFGHGRDLGPL